MFVNKLKMDEIAEAVKKCMAEDDLEETGLRKAAYAAHTKGEKMFTFKGKTYPVKVQGEDVSYGEAVKEEVEEVNEDNLDSIAKKHGMEFKRSTYGAKMTHPKHGEISINRYGEWQHYPTGSNSSKAHGDSTDKFSSLNKHLSSLKEETVDEAMSGEVTKTKTGLVHRSTKAYGGSKPEKHVVDTLKGPKTKDLMKQDKEAEMKTRGKYDEEMEFKNKLIEALKGQQHKIDKNKNKKIDAQDFAILRAQQKEEVEQVEEVKKPTGELKDACWKGYTAVGMKMKGGRKVPNCVPEEVEQEEVEQIEEKEMTASDKAERERIVKGMKKGFAGFRQRYGKRAKDVMYATATKQAMKEENVDEEIDPKVRTKDTTKGQEPTSQKDDVGPGSDGKSTKVKFRGGPMKEEVKKSDIPAFIRKARGDKPLTVADAKAGRKDSISSKENLAKARGVQEGKRPESDTVPFITDEKKPPFDKPYKKISSTVTDKSGAKHTPMSRARDLARSAMKRIKTEMLGKAPGNNG